MSRPFPTQSAMPNRLFPRSVAVWSTAACLLAGPGAQTALAHRVPPTDALTVTVVDNIGNAVSGATVQIIGPTSVAVASMSNVFVFSPIFPGAYRVRVWAFPYCLAEQLVNVAGATASTVVVNPTCGDRIDPGFTDLMIASVRGKADVSGTPTCLGGPAGVDQALQGFGPLTLPRNMLAPAGSPSCHNQVAVLSKEHAFWFSNDPTVIPWTNAAGDELVASPGPPLAVPMKMFIVSRPSGVTVDSMVHLIQDAHLGLGADLLVGSYTGLVLGAPPAGPVIEDLQTTHPELVSVVGTGCGSVGAIMSQPNLYDQGRLNVFYVADIGDESDGGSKAGLTCVAQGAPNIIFINSGEQGPFILVHEVGHALGLLAPNSGHTNNMSGFLLDSDSSDLDVMGAWSIAPRYLSVGQVIQMHLDARSWLNLPSAADASTLRGRAVTPLIPVVEPCGCPETAATTNCPPLALDIPRGLPLSSAPLLLQVCSISVTPPPPETPVRCSADTPVTALYFQGASPARASNATWTSLTPTILSVTPDNAFVPNGTRAFLRGVQPNASTPVSGTGTVKVWADGAVATFSVTVSCP